MNKTCDKSTCKMPASYVQVRRQLRIYLCREHAIEHGDWKKIRKLPYEGATYSKPARS